MYSRAQIKAQSRRSLGDDDSVSGDEERRAKLAGLLGAVCADDAMGPW